MSQFFASGGQSIGVSALASALPMNIQDWFPLELPPLPPNTSYSPRGLTLVSAFPLCISNPFCQQWCQWRALLEGTSLQVKSVLSDSLIVNSHQGRWPLRNEDGQENSLHVILWSLGKRPICCTKSMALESHTPGTDLWLHYSFAGWPWADDLTSLSFSFFMCFAGLW